MTATHSYQDDPRNADILICVNGEHKHRNEAVVSVFDSGFILGDGVWEGIRLHDGHLAFLGQHLDRLYEGAKALDMDIGLTPAELTARIEAICNANRMQGESGVHIRLMVTRGLKATPYQDPRVTIGPATIVIIPEYKTPKPETAYQPISLFTVHVRRGPADVQDPKLNSHSKLNCILACIQAAKAGADEALMLDVHGFVNTTNACNFFIVRKGAVWTSTGDYCMNGITRQKVIDLCHANGIPCQERNFSLVDTYGADEAFLTGTFGAQTPVSHIDGRQIGDGTLGPVTARLRDLYKALILS